MIDNIVHNYHWYKLPLHNSYILNYSAFGRILVILSHTVVHKCHMLTDPVWQGLWHLYLSASEFLQNE